MDDMQTHYCGLLSECRLSAVVPNPRLLSQLTTALHRSSDVVLSWRYTNLLCRSRIQDRKQLDCQKPKSSLCLSQHGHFGAQWTLSTQYQPQSAYHSRTQSRMR